MNKRNILVTGGNGQLGSELKELASRYVNCHFIFTDVENLDISDHKAVITFVDNNEINTIINCAAYTAVDKAEEQFELADKINHFAVGNFAQIAKDRNIQFVHISTDYVFDGINYKPYIESDSPNPKSVYGQTKLDGELVMQQINPKNSIIIRTSWVYSEFGNNFVKTMLKLGKERDELNVVVDQIGTPTYAADLAKTILDILPKINNTNVELFHYSNEGVASWFDFVKAIFDINSINTKLNPIESKAYPTPACRPFFSILNKNKIKNTYNIVIPYWRDSLRSCLKKI